MHAGRYFKDLSIFLRGLADAPGVTDGILEAAKEIENKWIRDERIATTGMGKAGHIARKLAATLSSIGFEAYYVHPGEAAHGDLGMIGDGDLVIALSNSGKTTEVLAFLDQVDSLWSPKVIAISREPEKMLFNEGIGLALPDCGEWDDEGLVPTVSMVLMLVVCDAIAMTARDLCGLTAEDFGKRHHGGYLGEKARGLV